MISENKLKHSIGVARECEKIAKELNLSKEEQNASFVMGFLHDIGYEVCENITDHPRDGAAYLDDFVKHSDDCITAIERHGLVREDLTIYDYILNRADLCINGLGEKVTFEERLQDIEERHGNDEHSQHAKEMLEIVKNYEV